MSNTNQQELQNTMPQQDQASANPQYNQQPILPPPPEVSQPAPSQQPMAVSRPNRTKEKVKEFKVSFKKNWALFRQSRLGVIGLGIIIVFVIMAIGSPFFGLRDPVRWYAPEIDIIQVSETYEKQTGTGAITTAPVLQLDGKSYGTAIEKIFVGNDQGQLIAFYPFEQPQNRIKWTYQCDGPITNPPRVKYNNVIDPSDDTIYVTTTKGDVYSIHADTVPEIEGGLGGKLAWVYKANSTISGGVGIDPRVDDPSGRFNNENTNEFYIGTDSGWAYRFWNNGNNITLIWQKHLCNSPLLTPLVDFYSDQNTTDDVVYFTSTNGQIFALDGLTGTAKWSAPYDVHSTLNVVPAIDFGAAGNSRHRLVIGNATGCLHFIDPVDGTGRITLQLTLPVNHVLYNKPSIYDKSPLTNVAMLNSGEELYVGSSNGVLYTFRRDPDVSTPPFWSYSIKWRYITPEDWNTGKPIPIKEDIAPAQTITMFTINGNKEIDVGGTSQVMNVGTVIGIDTQGNLTWIQDIVQGGNATSPTISNFFEQTIGRQSVYSILKQVYVGDSQGTIHAYDSGGTYLAPLPPSWVPGVAKPASGNMYLLGTDREGRDIFSQLIIGSRVALAVGILSAFFSVMLGTIVGVVAGYFSGAIDSILMRLADVIMVLPGLPILIISAALLGPNIWNIIIIISLLGWAGNARVIRAAVLSLKERPFVESAKITGASNSRIMFRHITPNVLPLAFLFMTFAVTGGILSEASLSYIGLGDPTVTSWGQMLFEVSRGGSALTAWWWVIPPGLFITLICLGFFLLGRAFDEIVNPRLRKR